MARFWPILLTGFCYSWHSGYVPIFQLCSGGKFTYNSVIKLVMKIYCIRKVIIVVNEESDGPCRLRVSQLKVISITRSLEVNFQFFKIPINLFFIRGHSTTSWTEFCNFLISRFFLAKDSSKIRTKTHSILVKTNLFFRFLEESSAWQFAFEIKWPLPPSSCPRNY